MKHLLEVVDLCVTYRTPPDPRAIALSGITFALKRGEVLGILGESGSGKSTLAAAILGALHANGKMEKGAVWFEGEDLVCGTTPKLEKIRGGRIGAIFQEPQLALHPCLRCGEQVADVLAAHCTMSWRAVRNETLRVLKTVFGEEAERIANAYPHQLSGGQRARVLTAQAIVCRPAILIADEPTASLDPSTQLEVTTLFRFLQREHGLSIILITHNPLLLAGLADRVLVLYAGRIAEIGPAETVLGSPCHPYTRGLLRCVPALRRDEAIVNEKRLPMIGEDLPSTNALEKCAFEGRCCDRMEICTLQEPKAVEVTEGHNVSCFKYGS